MQPATCKVQSAVYCPGLADIFTHFILGLPSLGHACPKWHASFAFTTVPIVFISLARPVKNMCISTHICSLLYNGYRVFPGGKERPGRDADPSPPSSAVVKKEKSYTSTSPMGRTVCTEPQYLYKGALYLLLTSDCVEIVYEVPLLPYNTANTSRKQCEILTGY